MLRVVFGDPLCTDHVILSMRSELCTLQNGKNAIFRLLHGLISVVAPKSDNVNRNIGVRDFKMWIIPPR